MAERGSDLVPAQRAHRDLDDFGERVAVEEMRDGVADVEHQHAEAAVVLVGTGAGRVSRLAHARDRSQRPVDQADHVADSDRTRGFPQEVASVLSALALEKSGLLELEEDLLEELDRDPLPLREFADRKQRTPELMGDPDVDQSSQGVLAALKGGTAIDGVVLAPPQLQLSVRTK